MVRVAREGEGFRRSDQGVFCTYRCGTLLELGNNVDLVDSTNEHFISISFKNAKIRIDREAIRARGGGHIPANLVIRPSPLRSTLGARSIENRNEAENGKALHDRDPDWMSILPLPMRLWSHEEF
jgi:hypothetical protein